MTIYAKPAILVHVTKRQLIRAGLISFNNYRLFLSRSLRRPFSVGALAPSSIFLGHEMMRLIPKGNAHEARHFLELGPGTGAFTGRLMQKLGPKDRLDLVECDADFCDHLRKVQGGDPRVAIYESSILDWSSQFRYDGIISSLPLVLFSPDAVRAILVKLESLIKRDGVLSYFEYVLVPMLRRALLTGEARRAIREVLRVKAQFMERYLAESHIVWWNLPPARVLHFRGQWRD